jgi:hypothetical protein
MDRINHLAVVIAGIVQFVFGAIWYTLFSQPWMTAVGKTQEQLKADNAGSPLPYIIAIVTAIIMAYTIAWLLPKLSAQSAAGGARVGVTLALTLIATTLALNYGFEGRSLTLWLINAGYITAGMAIMGAIVGAWVRKSSTSR